MKIAHMALLNSSQGIHEYYQYTVNTLEATFPMANTTSGTQVYFGVHDGNSIYQGSNTFTVADTPNPSSVRIQLPIPPAAFPPSKFELGRLCSCPYCPSYPPSLLILWLPSHRSLPHLPSVHLPLCVSVIHKFPCTYST